MKPVLIGAIVGIVSVSGGAYLYYSNEFDKGVKESVETFNADAENKFTVEYEDLSTNLLGGHVSATDIRITDKRKTDNVLHIGSVDADINIWAGLDSMIIQSGKISEISIGTPELKFSLNSVAVSGLKLAEAIDQFQKREFTSIPLTMFELSGLNAKVNSDKPVEINTDSIVFRTSDAGTKLEEFQYSGVAFKALKDKISMSLGNFHIIGGDLGWIDDMVWAVRTRAADNPFHDARAKKIAQKLAVLSLDYMGLESFEINDFKMTGPNDISLSLKDLYIKDLAREKGMVVAAKVGLTDMSVPNLKNFSPQANQVFTLADYNDFSMTMRAETKFDPAIEEMTNDSFVQIDELLKLSSDFKMSGVDLAKMYSALLPLQELQFEQMLADLSAPENDTPEAELENALNDMLEAMKAAYVGYYTGLETSLTIEDAGLNDKLLNFYAASTGQGRDQLRSHFASLAILNLAPLFGSSKPANMSQVFASYFADKSIPFQLNLRAKQVFTAENFDNLTSENWHELFDIELNQKTAQ